MNLDVYTLSLAIFVLNVIQVGLLLVQALVIRAYPGTVWWATGIFFAAMGFLSLALAPLAGGGRPPLLVFISNGSLILGQFCIWQGTQLFSGRKFHALPLGGVILLVVGIPLVLGQPEDLFWRRVLLLVSLATLAVMAALSILRPRDARIGVTEVLFSVAMGFHAVILTATLVATILVPPSVVVSSQPSLSETMALLDGLALTTLWTVGFILLANQRMARELKTEATTDHLTGLLNRRAFFEHLVRERDLALRKGSSLTLVLVDFDHFKEVNDRWGHPAGDRALQTFARRCRSQLRSPDLLARFGGDEFAILITELSLEEAGQVLARIHDAIVETPFALGAVQVPVTASFGGAWEVPRPNHDMARLISIADDALYRAKSAGRNRVELVLADSPA